MIEKRHNLMPDRRIIANIDYTFPKLKYSVNFRKIIRWLENFESQDVNAAIDFLFFLEYIDNSELTYRLDDLLQMIFELIPNDYNIYIFPGVATYPKSTEIISYVLKDTPSYKTRKQKHHCIITRDLERDLVKDVDSAIIFFDDFVGSGGSFKDGYDVKTGYKQWLDSNQNVKIRFLLSAVCMKKGREYINEKYPEIQIFSEFRSNIFDTNESPFKIKGNIEEMKELANNYGSNYCKNHNPLGFDESGALIAFSHTTPNNTIPIIWADNNWFPIFPRFAKTKMEQSKETKKEVAFYIGIMNRLGLDLYTSENIKVGNKRKIQYNNQKDHSLLCVMKLKQDGFEKPSICQILGITATEYQEIILYGNERDLLNKLGDLSNEGINFYRELMKKTKSRRFIKNDKKKFEKKYLNYVPKSFKGMS